MAQPTQSFWHTLREDAEGQRLAWHGLRTVVWSLFFHREFYSIFWYRVNHTLAQKGYRKLSSILRFRRQRWFGNDIDPYSTIGPGVTFGHLCGIIIGKGVVIGKNARIQQNVTIGTKHFTPHPNIKIKEEESFDYGVPRIGDNVAIGTGAVLVGNIVIEDNVTIGALSFINCDIPSDSVAYGIPPNRTIRSARAS